MNMYAQKTIDHGAAMADHKLLIGNAYIRGFLQGAEQRGYDPEKLLEQAGIPAHIYHDPEAVINGGQFRDLWRTVRDETDDVYMGFLERPGKIALEREQFRARMRCGTLGEAVRVGTQFREAVCNDVTYEYLLDDKLHEFTLEVQYQVRNGMDEHIFYWHRLLLIYRYHCWLIGKRIKLNRVCFATPKPDYCADYEHLFNCDIHFDQPHNSLSYDQKYLHFPVLPLSEDKQMEYMDKYPDWFEFTEVDWSWTGQVEQVILRLQREGNWTPTIEQVAQILSLGARTLRRQLERENETFIAIKARVRRDVAIKLLLTTDLPVTVIASQVGFQEPSGFTRAFLTWTQTTPSDYRAEHRDDKALIAAYSSRSSSQDRGNNTV